MQTDAWAGRESHPPPSLLPGDRSGAASLSSPGRTGCASNRSPSLRREPNPAEMDDEVHAAALPGPQIRPGIRPSTGRPSTPPPSAVRICWRPPRGGSARIRPTWSPHASAVPWPSGARRRQPPPPPPRFLARSGGHHHPGSDSVPQSPEVAPALRIPQPNRRSNRQPRKETAMRLSMIVLVALFVQGCV